jgi:hypothetical protein
VEAPTLEPHSTTGRTGATPSSPRPLPKLALGAAAMAVLALSAWFVLRAPADAPESPVTAASRPAIASAPSVEPPDEPAPVEVRVSRKSASREPETSVPSAARATASSARPPRVRMGEAPPAATVLPATTAPAEKDGLTVENPFR